MYNGYIESQSQTEARRARIEGWMQQREIMNQVIADVAPRLNLFLEVCGDIDAGNGELFPIDAGGVDVQDAVNWQDEPEYKEAQKVSDNFNFETVAEQEF